MGDLYFSVISVSNFLSPARSAKLCSLTEWFCLTTTIKILHILANKPDLYTFFAAALVEVVDSEYRALASPQFYNPGSEIALGCVVRSRENWSTEVAWFKDGAPIDLSHRPTVR